jgi:beta-glucosidase
LGKAIDYQLRGSRWVTLAAGESATVQFTLTSDQLLFTGADMASTVEPGRFQAWVGPHAAGGLEGEFGLQRQVPTG